MSRIYYRRPSQIISNRSLYNGLVYGARWNHALGAFDRFGHVARVHPSILCRSIRRPSTSDPFSTSVQTLPKRNLFSGVSFRDDDTIYALSTAPGRAAIAVIRVSGPACLKVYRSLCPLSRDPQPRHALVRRLSNPRNQAEILDPSALVIHFPAPRTTTGEDVLEFHTHGGPAIVKSVLSAIAGCATASHPIRYAEAGEFTKRAFLNDRLSLPQVEALGETLNAVTEEQRRLAVAGTQSGLSSRYEFWRSMLLAARGELEALIDFSEDQHFDESPLDLTSNVAEQVRHLLRLIVLHSKNAMRGELLRNGISLSLIGSPNVGKSSLLNCIVGRDAAIVSTEAGTTRDVVEIGVDIGGYFCRLGDTAGIRSSQDQDTDLQASNVNSGSQIGLSKNSISAIEAEGIKRAHSRAESSDLVLLVLSIEPSVDSVGVQLKIDTDVLSTAQRLMDQGKNMVAIVNKMDRYDLADDTPAMDVHLQHSLAEIMPNISTSDMFFVSCQDAESESSRSGAQSSDPGSIQLLLKGLGQKFRTMTSPLTPSDTTSAGISSELEGNDASVWAESLGATERHRLLLEECAVNLEDFLAKVDRPLSQDSQDDTQSHIRKCQVDEGDRGLDIVLAAESLRRAAGCLARITGRNADAGDVEEVLGVVFEK